MVWVSLEVDGSLRFAGLDYAGPDGPGHTYEYDVVVRRRDVPRVLAALGGQPGDDVVALCVVHGEQIFRQGEKAWLESLGLKPELSVWR